MLGFALILLQNKLYNHKDNLINFAKICIYRKEQMGELNISPVYVSTKSVIYPYKNVKTPILSKINTCIRTKSGTVRITLIFNHPYRDRLSTPQVENKNYYFLANPSNTNFIVLDSNNDNNPDDPSWDSVGWKNIWILRRR
jgi:hypothetical protein